MRQSMLKRARGRAVDRERGTEKKYGAKAKCLNSSTEIRSPFWGIAKRYQTLLFSLDNENSFTHLHTQETISCQTCALCMGNSFWQLETLREKFRSDRIWQVNPFRIGQSVLAYFAQLPNDGNQQRMNARAERFGQSTTATITAHHFCIAFPAKLLAHSGLRRVNVIIHNTHWFYLLINGYCFRCHCSSMHAAGLVARICDVHEHSTSRHKHTFFLASTLARAAF